jgi:hypothetical protein
VKTDDPKPIKEPNSEGVGSMPARVWAVVYQLLPRSLQEVHKQGLTRWVAYLVFALLVAPLLIVLLTSVWLGLARDSWIPGVQGLRNAYVSQIRQGFGVDDSISHRVAALDSLISNRVEERERVQNTLLDYLQVVEFGLEPDSPARDRSSVKNYNIRLKKRQRVRVELNYVGSEPLTQANCIYKTGNRSQDPILSIQIGTKQWSCPETHGPKAACGATLNEDWWKDPGNVPDDTAEGEDVVVVVTFRPKPEFRATCGLLKAEGYIAVFKGLVPHPSITGPISAKQ